MTDENTLRQNMAKMITPMTGFVVVNAIEYINKFFPPFKNIMNK
jgi:hypothetical protein